MNHIPNMTTLQGLLPTVDIPLIQDFLDRMDPDYFSQFPLETVSTHLRLANDLTLEQPSALRLQPEKHKARFQLTLVAYDYFSEFATICGLLSAYGLDIREAFIFTYLDQGPSSTSSVSSSKAKKSPIRPGRHKGSHPGLSRKKVVDVFHVQVLPGYTFATQEQQAFSHELMEMIRLLDARKTQEVRTRVNRKLVEALGKRKTTFANVVHPVEIQFNNTLSPRDTVMDIGATDSPAFLYAFANALTMRGLYLSKATIEVEGSRVRNRFFVRGRQNQKILAKEEQQELAIAATFIKEFTLYLTWAPDPSKALAHFDQFLDQLLDTQPTKKQFSWLNKKTSLAHLAQLFGTSDFLWEDFLRRQHSNLLPIMEDFHKYPGPPSKTQLVKTLQKRLGKTKTPEKRKAILNEFKDEELFRIDMGHILNSTPLPDFSKSLTILAEVILDQALLEAQTVVNQSRTPPPKKKGQLLPLTICGLGKLGGQELGYASDIEVVFIYDVPSETPPKDLPKIGEYYERLIQEFLQWIEAKQEGIFQIDTRLRPHGEKGLLANSLEEVQRYYSETGSAAPFERQAWIKLRHVAGDPILGRKIEAHRDTYVYSEAAWPLETALHLRYRQTRELVPPGAIHVKYSPGGLIDIEYTAQYLQLMHGHYQPTIRTTHTLDALHALKETQYLSTEEEQSLRENYIFMRRVIDGLRIVRGNAKDLVLPESNSEDMVFLARRLGYITEVWKDGAKKFEEDLNQRMARSHHIFNKLFTTKKK
jgi:[glutamine synthetase] adenylyltransferase / [glutamine synthetase]-adenylyl-L-tyrosine phosphorylase